MEPLVLAPKLRQGLRKMRKLGITQGLPFEQQCIARTSTATSLLFDSLGTPCNFELPPCQYIRSLCISPLFPHTHTHALFPIFLFSISNALLAVGAEML